MQTIHEVRKFISWSSFAAYYVAREVGLLYAYEYAYAYAPYAVGLANLIALLNQAPK